jgi:hypothetical protein
MAVGGFQRVNKAERCVLRAFAKIVGDGVLCVLRGLFSLDDGFRARQRRPPGLRGFRI